MTPEQASNINTWLAVMAIASAIQVIALAVVAMVVYRMSAKASTAMDRVGQQIDRVEEQIEPVKRRVLEVLDSVHEEVARVRRVGDRVEDSVSAVGNGVSAATSAVKHAVLPGWAVTKGVLAAVSAFAGRERQNGRLAGQVARREIEETRFVNEGGNDARDEELRF